MEIQDKTTNNTHICNIQNSKTPNFKGAGLLINYSGSIMQGLENQGFWLQFICQDFLGMTVPRTITGFKRDKDITGEYNMQEGFEVLGREGMTGPFMMAVAPIAFLISARFAKTTGVNTKLIKRYGNSFKEMIQNKTAYCIKKPEDFKLEFYKLNIDKILKNTVGEGKYTQDDINTIINYVKKCEEIPKDANLKGLFGKKKYRDEQLAEIKKYINKLVYEKSGNLDMLEHVKTCEQDCSFATKDAIEGMIKYSDDVIKFNKNAHEINVTNAEDLKQSLIGRRVVTNIATIFSTLGILSVLPKIYARNDIAPGIKTAMAMDKKDSDKNDNNENSNINFKGKGDSDIFKKIGDFVTKNVKDKYLSELEYNGNNFTNTLMAGLSVFGLLFPRGRRAVKRAPEDENGKKDMSELREILLRDLTSSLSVVFAVPLLTRACVSSYENQSGYVLMHRDRSVKGWKKVLELINPYSSSKILTNSEIDALYNGVDNGEKMIKFCEYMDKNGGDLEKILSNTEFKDTIQSAEKLTKEQKNKKIIDLFKSKRISDETIKKNMNFAKPGNNKMLSLAKGLNSVPGMIATFIISPIILGVLIPKLTYYNTRKYHEKQKEKNSITMNA